MQTIIYLQTIIDLPIFTQLFQMMLNHQIWTLIILVYSNRYLASMQAEGGLNVLELKTNLHEACRHCRECSKRVAIMRCFFVVQRFTKFSNKLYLKAILCSLWLCHQHIAWRIIYKNSLFTCVISRRVNKKHLDNLSLCVVSAIAQWLTIINK